MTLNSMISRHLGNVTLAILSAGADSAKWVVIWLMAVVSGSLVATASQGADYYVAPHGRDGDEGGGRGKPWATLQFAADHVKPGDTVHVLDGDYTGFYVSRSGEFHAPIQFIAEGGSVRIIRRNRETPDGINIEGASHIVVSGFVIDNMPRAGIRATHSAGSTIRRIRADSNSVWGICTSFCDDVRIESNTVSRSIKEHGIYVSNSGDRPVIRGNVIRDNRQCGIHLNGDLSQGGDGVISGPLIENNVISGNGRDGGSGINGDGVQNALIQNNLLYDNRSSGVSLYRVDGATGSTANRIVNNTIIQPAKSRWAINIKNESTNNLIANNILINKGSRGIISVSADSMPGLVSDYNIVDNRLSPDGGEEFMDLNRWRSRTGLDGHSLYARPKELFKDEPSADFRLCDGSPANDAADPELAPRVDIKGRARPVGDRPDIGAYEYEAE